MNIADLSRGDSVCIDFSGGSGDWPTTYEVHDTDTQNIGLVTIIIVALKAGCTTYVLRDVSGDDTVTLRNADGGGERQVRTENIDTFESAAELA